MGRTSDDLITRGVALHDTNHIDLNASACRGEAGLLVSVSGYGFIGGTLSSAGWPVGPGDPCIVTAPLPFKAEPVALALSLER